LSTATAAQTDLCHRLEAMAGNPSWAPVQQMCWGQWGSGDNRATQRTHISTMLTQCTMLGES